MWFFRAFLMFWKLVFVIRKPCVVCVWPTYSKCDKFNSMQYVTFMGWFQFFYLGFNSVRYSYFLPYMNFYWWHDRILVCKWYTACIVHWYRKCCIFWFLCGLIFCMGYHLFSSLWFGQKVTYSKIHSSNRHSIKFDYIQSTTYYYINFKTFHVI